MYREIRDCSARLDSLQAHLDAALQADDTRTIGAEATNAQAVTVELLNHLKSTVQAANGQANDANITFVEAAIAALNRGWVDAEKMAMGRSASEMRGNVAAFKTQADYARAYLRAAVGAEDV